MVEDQPVLDVRNASIAYQTARGPVLAARDVSLTVYPHEIVGLIGESGSGKSTLAYGIMRLLKNGARLVQGEIRILGRDVYAMQKEELRAFRWLHMSMVFQSAMNALNPVLTIEDQIIDTLQSHQPQMTRREASLRARELAEMVRIDASRLSAYPHELSGGMRQRFVIAIAIALEPALVIMDEPTTALDVVVQRSILDQIREIQKVKGFSILFISHDFSLVAEFASRIAVMYAGRIVEVSASGLLDGDSLKHHPYTVGLWNAIPQLRARQLTLSGIPGSPPDIQNLPSGCAFHPRCTLADDTCRTSVPDRWSRGKSVIECHRFEVEEGATHE
ncbi:MAG: ABC transporter ATP-binding protein [Firmicutes bacterium]|nr:ABC transporter ATP-binding protein [Bacillota bacterium]